MTRSTVMLFYSMSHYEWVTQVNDEESFSTVCGRSCNSLTHKSYSISITDIRQSGCLRWLEKTMKQSVQIMAITNIHQFAFPG